MKKKVYICINIILFLLLIINIKIYTANHYIDLSDHNYKCILTVNNDDLETVYNYIYDITTDGFYHLKDNKYIERFTYNNDNNYAIYKAFYQTYYVNEQVNYDDDKRTISIIRENMLNNNDTIYNQVKTSFEMQGFKCEE